MEYRFAMIGECERIAKLHPELADQRPDLASPAFPDNPVSGQPDFPFIFYALDQGKVVGSRKAIPDHVLIGGQKHPWAWCFDTIVEANQHGKGIGSQLVKLQVEAFDVRGAVSGAAFSVPAMMHIYNKFGYRVLDFTPRMTALRNSRPFLTGKVPLPLLPSAARAVNVAFALERLMRTSAHEGADITVEPIAPVRLAQLHDEAALHPQTHRWAIDGNWIVARLQPGDRTVQLRHAGADRPIAIAVLRDRAPTDDQPGRRVSLMHFSFLHTNGDESKSITLLPAALFRYISALGMDQIDIISSYPPLLAAAARCGYRRRGEGMTFVYKLPPNLLLEAPLNISEWELTHFCSD